MQNKNLYLKQSARRAVILQFSKEEGEIVKRSHQLLLVDWLKWKVEAWMTKLHTDCLEKYMWYRACPCEMETEKTENFHAVRNEILKMDDKKQ